MNALAICAMIGLAVIFFAWVVLVDWCVVGIIRACQRRQIIRQRLAELGHDTSGSVAAAREGDGASKRRRDMSPRTTSIDP